MPINPKLKEHLEKNTQMDAAYRAKLIETLEDAPADVQNLWMSQSDYTREMNRLKDGEKTYKAQMDDFYAKSNANIDAWKTQVEQAKAAATAAQARVDALEAGTGARTPAEEFAASKEITRLNDAITKLQAGIDDKLKSAVTAQDLEKAYGNAVGFIGEQVMTLNEISAQHQEQFGKRLTKQEQAELITFANEKAVELKRSIGLEDAYRMKMGTEINRLHDEKVAAEAVEKYKSTHELPTGGPTGGGPGLTEKGPLQIRIEQERALAGGGSKPDGVYADWREAAAAASSELVKEGKY